MTTTTEAYRVQYEANEDGYGWHVLDTDGEAEDSFETRVEAATQRKQNLLGSLLEKQLKDAIGTASDLV